MLNLIIRLTKKPDASSVLCCQRPDGTQTWQRNRDSFFAFHDLTHFAVETTLDLRFGFYGLVAQGWKITDFGSPWPRGRIPPKAVAEASLAETVTGLLDIERHSGVVWGLKELNTSLAQALSEGKQRLLTQEELDQIRLRCRELFKDWESLEGGQSMVLEL